MTVNPDHARFDVAVIGMSGRFPGAKNPKEFWNNLAQGVESIRTFTDEELLQRGVHAAFLQDSNFVKSGSVLSEIDQFAAPFFGYSPREAELTDPQHRLFLECSWEALEDAGYAPRHLKGQVGVYAGSSLSSYMLFNLAGNPAVHPIEEAFQVMLGGDKDFLCTRLSYKLNLRGPSLTIQTGCSTSLVAAHFAVQSLITYQCDMAITGGVSISVPHRTGYHYQPGGVASPDGHCRPFDAAAQGTIFGDGAGVLVLKRLEDAIAARDHIYFVIRGSAINNDGSSKIGYTAPSIEGQVEVISRAQEIAGVPSDSISYIEAHGTGTALGDPIEAAALSKVFGKNTLGPNSCALGSVKSNIGHLDAAAGIAGLIKVGLMLANGYLVPTLHFQQPNPKIDFDNSPFYVNTKCKPWVSESGPLRAGVSSFGIGGTNAHVILEEAPMAPATGPSRPLHLLCLSADTETALARATENLSAHLGESPAACLADIAYTLHTGREQFKYRRALVCSDVEDARAVLRKLPQDRIFNGQADTLPRKVAFLFPGGGAQYVGMGAELYRTEVVFRKQMDTCAVLLQGTLGYDLRDLLYESGRQHDIAKQRLLRTSAALPAIFATEYALAKLFLSWGVNPNCLIGHSLGEYTAACLAGVFSLEDAVRLVAFRGHIIESLPNGSMMSVNLPECDLHDLPEGISVAAINTPDQCVLSGPTHLIEEHGATLQSRNIEHHRLHIEAAGHCSLVEPIMEQFRDFLASVSFSKPVLPFVSNLTGTWITEQQARDVDYWVNHLRHTVRFSEGLQNIAKEGGPVLLEVGPGRSLSSFAKQLTKDRTSFAFSSMRHPNDTASDLHTIYGTLAKLWTIGVELDWPEFYASEQRNRLSLPTYPFERQAYWIGPPSTDALNQLKTSSGVQAKSRFYVPSWMRTETVASSLSRTEHTWIVLADPHGLATECVKTLEKAGQQAVVVKIGSGFSAQGTHSYTVRSGSEQDFQELLHSLALLTPSINILHLWSLTDQRNSGSEGGSVHEFQDKALYSLLNLTRAISKSKHSGEWRVFVVSNGVVQVSGGDDVQAAKSSLIAGCTVIPQEYSQICCSLIDIVPQSFSFGTLRRLSAQILAEASADANIDSRSMVAYRGHQRWARSYGMLDLASVTERLDVGRKPRVYLITGGLGTLGLALAHHLADIAPSKIVLTTRSNFPGKKHWDHHSKDEKWGAKIHLLKELEEKGTDVSIATADVADQDQMERLVCEMESKYGSIHGVIHLAGITGDAALRLVADLSETECVAQLRPKVDGCLVLRNIFAERSIDFCALFSSTASILGGPGMAAYAAASCFLDSFAMKCHLEGQRWISINWDGWIADDSSHFVGHHATSLDRYALRNSEALSLLDTILANQAGGQIVVSSGDICSRVDEWVHGRKSAFQASQAQPLIHNRPSLCTDYVPASDPLQKQIAAIWSEVLGIEQVGIYDNLFDLGGSSLIGLRIVARLKKDLNISIPVTALFEGPTIVTLSQLIQAKASPETYSVSRERGELRRNKRKAARLKN
jgi:phthiocerol/phenolphthiocerol synthesis type-I polyketide synthase E